MLASCVTAPVEGYQPAEAAPIPTCISPTTEANPYFSPSPLGAVSIYNEFKTNAASLENTRLKAFSLLGKYTEHWSSFLDLSVSDSQTVRITVTYIDPVLFQYMALNNILSNSWYIDQSAFQSDLVRVMQNLRERNELLFVFTITASSYEGQANNTLSVNLSIRDMELVNSRNTRVRPTQTDPALGETIQLGRGPVSGIVAYPISLFMENSCTWLMDQGNTTLTLSIPEVSVGVVTYNSLSWSIPYRAIVPQDTTIMVVNTPYPTFDANSDLARIKQPTTPPSPGRMPNPNVDDLNKKNYWEDMGLYLWGYIIPRLYR